MPQEFAERIHADLQAKGVRCWFAPHDIQGGRKIHEQIDEAIRLHDRVLLILSEHSMNSEWVKTEIAKASKRELKEGKRVLFPVRLVEFETLRDWECFDGDTGKDSAREIREYFIPDFSNWKDHVSAAGEGLEGRGWRIEKAGPSTSFGRNLTPLGMTEREARALGRDDSSKGLQRLTCSYHMHP